MIFFPPQSLKAIFASGIRLEFLSHKNHHCKQPKSFLKAMTEKKSVYFSWKFCLWDSSVYSYCFRDDTLPPSLLVILLQIYDGYQSAARVTPGARSAFNVFIVGLQPQLR